MVINCNKITSSNLLTNKIIGSQYGLVFLCINISAIHFSQLTVFLHEVIDEVLLQPFPSMVRVYVAQSAKLLAHGDEQRIESDVQLGIFVRRLLGIDGHYGVVYSVKCPISHKIWSGHFEKIVTDRI